VVFCVIQSAIVCCVRLFSLARVTELHRLFQQHTSSVTSTILDSHSLLQLSHAAVVGECSIIVGNNCKGGILYPVYLLNY